MKPLVMALVIGVLGCVDQQQPPPNYPAQQPPPYPQPQPAPYDQTQAQAGYPPPQNTYPPPAQPGYPPAQPGYPPAQPGYPPAQPGYPPAPVAAAPARRFSFNGRPATAGDLQVLQQIERMYGRATPPGDYWYDPVSGAAGAWGGPALGFLPAGLQFGGPLPAHASGGGSGALTGVFINGRELHPVDVQVLFAIYGQVIPGRWWVDGQGNAGQEGGPALINLVALARQRAASGKGKGAESYYRSDGRGNNAFVGGGCVSSSHTTGSGDSKKTYDYYGPGC